MGNCESSEEAYQMLDALFRATALAPLVLSKLLPKSIIPRSYLLKNEKHCFVVYIALLAEALFFQYWFWKWRSEVNFSQPGMSLHQWIMIHALRMLTLIARLC